MMIHMKLIVMATTMMMMMMMVVAPTKGPRSVIDLDKPDQLGLAFTPVIRRAADHCHHIYDDHDCNCTHGSDKMLQLILKKKHVTLLSAWCCCVADLVLNLAL